MNLCNICGVPITSNRYGGLVAGLCSDCEREAREEYHANQPADDMDEPTHDPECAWCAEESGTPPGERGSTGICPRHRQQFIAQAFADRAADRQGKHEEQLIFSAAVLLVCLALGILLGVWVAFAK